MEGLENGGGANDPTYKGGWNKDDNITQSLTMGYQ